MLSMFTNGVYGCLDLILLVWALGLLLLAGRALLQGGSLREKVRRFLDQETFLFGGWGGQAREAAGRWLFLAAVVSLQFYIYFLNSLLRETGAAWHAPLTLLAENLYLWAAVVKLLLFTRYSGWQLGVGFCGFFVFRWVFLNNHAIWMILGVLFALAAKDADLRRTLKAALAVSAAGFLATVLSAAAGWIPTLEIAGNDLVRGRDSFGYGWFNLTGALLLGICLMYLCWRQVKNLRWFDFVLLGCALVFCDQGPDSRGATVCIALLLVLAALLRFWPQLARPAWVRGLAAAVPPLGFAASLLSSWFYSEDVPLWRALDNLFTGRLALGHEALTQTSLAIAGQGLWDKNFIVDNYYVYLWVYAGPVASLLVWGAAAVLLWRLLKKGALAESVCLVVMLAHATMESHFVWPCINITLWLLPCVLYWLPAARTPSFAPEEAAPPRPAA